MNDIPASGPVVPDSIIPGASVAASENGGARPATFGQGRDHGDARTAALRLPPLDSCRAGSDPALHDIMVAASVTALAALSILTLAAGPTGPVLWPVNAVPIACLLAAPRPSTWRAGAVLVALTMLGTMLGTLAGGLAAGSALVTALMAAANVTVAGVLGRVLPGPRPGIFRPPAIVKLGVSAVLAGPAAGALVALLATRLAGIGTPVSFTASAVGALLYLPACIILAGGRRRSEQSNSLKALAVLLVILGAVSVQPVPGALLVYIVLLTLFALIYGAVPTAFALAAVGLMPSLLTLHGLGPLTGLSSDPAQRFAMLQRFLAGCAISALPAALIMEWRSSQMARLRLEQARLRMREARYRAMATISADVILVSRTDGQIAYVSPAVERLLGLPAPMLTGRNAFEFIHPEDAGRVRSEFGALGGAVREITVETRLCPGGCTAPGATPIWVEIRTRLGDRREDGDIEFVSVVRDVSARRAKDERRSADLARLARLANTDPLTGLANRRRFMEHLELEWRRALREQSELALMLIDVDRFKSFNDHYGHPAGDAALQGVAAIIAATALRPADLAVRLGGEEFAVILPNTFLSGARTLAERIRDGLKVAATPHLGSPSGHLTVSIGICCLRPSPDEQPQRLIDRADEALYAAKIERDCVRIAT